MKKPILLIAAALSAGITGQAQNFKKLSAEQSCRKTEPKNVDAESLVQFPVLDLKPSVNNTNNKLLMPPPYPKIGSSGNAFTIAQAYSRNCLTYNKNINTVLFTHRKSVGWTFTTPAGANSGTIQGTWTTNGTTFDSTIVFVDGTNLGRYPAGAIFNPTGNTDPANAKLVACGRYNAGSGWTGNYFTYGPLTKGAITNTNQFVVPNYAAYTTNGNNIMGKFSGPGTSMDEVNGTIWSAAVHYGGDINGGTSPTWKFNGATVIKASTADNGATFTWKTDSIKPALKSPADGSNYLWNDQLVAFGPDGKVGYVVMVGMEANAAGSRRAYQPILYKTTDAGATWNQVNASYDWAAGKNPCLMASIAPVRGNPALAKPYIAPLFGWDATVDNQNRLHVVTAIASGFSDHDDSLTYTYNFDYKDYFPYVWDLVTTGDGTWTEYLVDSLITDELDDTQSENPWTTGTGKLGYDNRIQCSRLPDGTRIFVGWTDTDTNVTSSTLNTNPDVYFKAINATNMKMAPKKCVFSGLGLCHFMSMSNYTMEPTPGNYTIPFTYTTNGTSNADIQVNHFYINDATISDAAINVPYNCHLIGMKENHGAIAAVAQNTPNPCSDVTTINVSLLSAEDINMSVYNNMGQLVNTRKVKGISGNNAITLNTSNLTDGIYFYTIQVNDHAITKKMTVSK